MKCVAALNPHCTALCRRRNASKAKDMVEMDELWSPWGVSPFHHHTPSTNQPEPLEGCKVNLCFVPITGGHHSTAPQNKSKQVASAGSGHLSLTLTLLQLFYLFHSPERRYRRHQPNHLPTPHGAANVTVPEQQHRSLSTPFYRNNYSKGSSSNLLPCHPASTPQL